MHMVDGSLLGGQKKGKLVMLQMKMVLVTVLSRYQLDSGKQRRERPIMNKSTLLPARGGKIVVKGKRQQKQKVFSYSKI